MEKLISQAIEGIGALNEEAIEAAKTRQDSLTKPQGSLGRLEELAIHLAGIRHEFIPCIKSKAIITMAADHGVVTEGVSAYPQEVTSQMVYNFLRDGAGINVLARHVGARVVVVDMGVAKKLDPHPNLVSRKVALGTRNMAIGPAMTRSEAEQAIETGIQIIHAEIKKGLDIVGTGDMGIGNTTASSAICAAITGQTVANVTGRGSGVEDEQLAHKVEVIERALAVNRPDVNDPVDVLSKVGGFEIGGLAGIMLGAAANHIPVVIDGFISGAAALIAVKLCPSLKDYLIAAHISVEVGHKIMLDYLGLKPLLDLNMRLGEGTGAALGIFLAEASTKILAEMATFAEAGVSGKE